MSRREFGREIRKTVIKRASRTTPDGLTNIYCEACGALAKRFQIDHIIADAHGGDPTLENAQLLGPCCFEPKNVKDTKIAAKIKRQEAWHIGASVPTARKLQGPGFRPSGRRKQHPIPPPPRRSLFEAETQ